MKCILLQALLMMLFLSDNIFSQERDTKSNSKGFIEIPIEPPIELPNDGCNGPYKESISSDTFSRIIYVESDIEYLVYIKYTCKENSSENLNEYFQSRLLSPYYYSNLYLFVNGQQFESQFLESTNGMMSELKFSVSKDVKVLSPNIGNNDISINEQCIKVEGHNFAFSAHAGDCNYSKEIKIHSLRILAAPSGGPNEVSYFYDKNGNRVNKYITEVSSTTLKNSSVDTSSIIIDPFELLNAENISITPNPTRGDVYISIQNMNPEKNYSYSLYGIDGNLLESNIIINSSRVKVNMSTCPSGLYFIVLKYGDQSFTYKIVSE